VQVKETVVCVIHDGRVCSFQTRRSCPLYLLLQDMTIVSLTTSKKITVGVNNVRKILGFSGVRV